jgi:hypothetical protein
MPFMAYKGPHDAAEIRRFVLEVANKVKSNQQHDEITNSKIKKDIPDYCIGNPLCGDGKVCYLDFDEAYGKIQATSTRQ